MLHDHVCKSLPLVPILSQMHPYPLVLFLLTPCGLDGLLIKYPQFPDILNALNVQPQTYYYLRFDTVNYAPQPQTEETACR